MTFFSFISFKSESLLSTTLPRCLAFVTQSTLFPLTWMALQLPLLAPNTIPVVFLSLNVTWNSFPYSSHIFTMYCRPCSEGDNNVISSAYDNAPTKCWETRHPYPLLANLAINSSQYTANSIGDITAPCFTPLHTWKLLDVWRSHCAHIRCLM